MKIIFTFLLIIVNRFSVCQGFVEYTPNASDQLGIKVRIVNRVMHDRCGCEFGDKQKKECVLYLAKVDSFMFVRKTLDTIPSIITLQKAFLLIPSTEDKFKIDDVCIVTAYRSYYDYLIVNKIFYEDVHILKESGDFVSASGPCFKMNFFEKLFLQLGFYRNKQYKVLKKNENPFWAETHQSY